VVPLAGLPPQNKRDSRHTLVILAACLLWFSITTYVSLLTPYVEGLGASHAMAGIIVGSFGFIQIFLRIPLGLLSDSLGRRKIFIQLSFVFSLLSAAGFLSSHNLVMILVARTLAGVAATNWIHFNILYPKYFPEANPSKAIGILNASAMMAQTLALLCGGALADRTSMDAVFMLSAFTAMIGLGVSWFVVEQGSRSAGPASLRSSFRAMGTPGLLAMAAFAILVQMLTYTTTFGFLPLYARMQFGATGSALALLSVIATIAGALSSLIGNTRLVKRFSELSLAMWGILAFALSSAAIPLMPSLSALAIIQVVAGLGRGVAFTMAMAIAIQSVPENNRATSMGFYQASYGIGMVAGPVVMGALSDAWGIPKAFVMMGLATVLLSLALLPVCRQYSRPMTVMDTRRI
jgi:predicted MFS family arabinose efflux permease